MKRLVKFVAVCMGLGILSASLSGCSQDEKNTATSSSIASESDHSATRFNYSQMPDGSVVIPITNEKGELIEERQVNFATSDWQCFLYSTWIYAEVNEQVGKGLAAGVSQVDVTLQNVAFTFSGLPSEITEVVAAIKNLGASGVPITYDTPEDTYTEIGRYPVLNGSVTIYPSLSNLVKYFGKTHYSIWFQVIGRKNGQGIQGGSYLSMSGTMPNGQNVQLGRYTCFGSNPMTTPPTPVVVEQSFMAELYGDVAKVVEFAVIEPDNSKNSAYIESGALRFTNNGSTSWVENVAWPPLVISGTPNGGTYRINISNEWASLNKSCPADPVAVSLTLTTQSSSKVLNCNIPCGKVYQVNMAFPAGTINEIPAYTGWCW